MLSGFDWLAHGFGTRLDAAALRDSPGSSQANLKQIHSAIVVEAKAPGHLGEGDALVTHQPNLELAVRTADCYPILLVDPHNRAVAAIHAGWRGTAGKIVQMTLEKMSALYGTTPSQVYAAIGPGIGVCCFEVGEEVAGQFAKTRSIGKNGRAHVNLAQANQDQLLEAGLQSARIEVMGNCTFCDAAKFFSFRRERDRAGRMISHVRIMKPSGTASKQFTPPESN